MCCGGKHKSERTAAKRERPADYFLTPFAPCVLCAEKHISDAWDLARECGYETPNRQTVIGALGSAARHLWSDHREFAERVRAFRHQIQLRQESGLDWRPILTEIDVLAAAEVKNTRRR